MIAPACIAALSAGVSSERSTTALRWRSGARGVAVAALGGKMAGSGSASPLVVGEAAAARGRATAARSRLLSLRVMSSSSTSTSRDSATLVDAGVGATYSYSRNGLSGTVKKWWEHTSSTPINMKEIIEAEELFGTIAKAGERVVVVEFFAGWCAACRSLYPKLCKIASVEFPNAEFLKVNIDAHEALCQDLGVDRLPTFMVYRDSCLVTQFTASLSAQGLRKLREGIGEHYSKAEALL